MRNSRNLPSFLLLFSFPALFLISKYLYNIIMLLAWLIFQLLRPFLFNFSLIIPLVLVLPSAILFNFSPDQLLFNFLLIIPLPRLPLVLVLQLQRLEEPPRRWRRLWKPLRPCLFMIISRHRWLDARSGRDRHVGALSEVVGTLGSCLRCKLGCL